VAWPRGSNRVRDGTCSRRLLPYSGFANCVALLLFLLTVTDRIAVVFSTPLMFRAQSSRRNQGNDYRARSTTRTVGRRLSLSLGALAQDTSTGRVPLTCLVFLRLTFLLLQSSCALQIGSGYLDFREPTSA
jgi:hypothetical protein